MKPFTQVPRLESFGVTDKGKIRESNQDHFLIASLYKRIELNQSSVAFDEQSELTARQGHLLIVADGMGGHAAGEIAAKLAIQSFADYLLSRMHWHLHSKESYQENVLDAFIQALEFCQNELQKYAELHPECSGMGTTLTVAYLAWPQLFVLHAGDSRCYIHSGSSLKQLTTDHTVTQQLVDQNLITIDQASRSPFANCLWNAVGGNSTAIEPQLIVVELKPGETILLCSDGLTKHLSDDEIANHLQSNQNPEQACQHLLQVALEAGGRDNVTLIVARVEGAEQEKTNDGFLSRSVRTLRRALTEST